MMSYLTYITGFFMNFELLPIMQIRKKGVMKFKKNLLSNMGTFWLKIEQFWPFEEISIFNNGGHLGYTTALTDTILKGDHLRIISAKFG
jgi:uncharacterized membrane protein